MGQRLVAWFTSPAWLGWADFWSEDDGEREGGREML